MATLEKIHGAVIGLGVPFSLVNKIISYHQNLLNTFRSSQNNFLALKRQNVIF